MVPAARKGSIVIDPVVYSNDLCSSSAVAHVANPLFDIHRQGSRGSRSLAHDEHD